MYNPSPKLEAESITNKADEAASAQSGLPAFFYYMKRTRSQRHAEIWLRLYREAQKRATQ